jgi:hypothetical protein
VRRRYRTRANGKANSRLITANFCGYLSRFMMNRAGRRKTHSLSPSSWLFPSRDSMGRPHKWIAVISHVVSKFYGTRLHQASVIRKRREKGGAMFFCL